MKRIINCLALFFISITSFGQVNNNWFLKEGVFLDFNSGKPLYSRTDSLIKPSFVFTGHASVSDKKGNLLFYTDGFNVWNAQNKVMPNGIMASSMSSISQSALIIPNPSNSDQYYLFTTSYSGMGGLYYSLIDMTLSEGLGDVMDTKNFKLSDNVMGLTTAIRMTNEKGFWIIAHDRNASFLAYQLTSNGINKTPVTSSIGTSYYNSGGKGYLKHSKKGDKLALSNYGLGLFEIFNFNCTTGRVSEVITSPVNYPYIYGVEFSPDDSRLYISAGNSNHSIYQVNLKAGTPSEIMNSTLLIASSKAPSQSQIGALQLGPDCRIYVAKENINSIGVINNPNTLGAACNYVAEQLLLPTYAKNEQFPRDFPNFFEMSCCAYSKDFLGNDTTVCDNNALLLSAGAAKSYLWSTGSTSSSLLVSHPGNYWVELTTDECVERDSLIVEACAAAKIEFPTIFTPNNDGQNDRFIPLSYTDIAKASLKIYNRWGKEIFATTDVVQGWDGYNHAGKCDTDAYFWTLNYTTLKGEDILAKGIITLSN